MSLSCPECQSDNTQKVSIAYSHGTTLSTKGTAGVGMSSRGSLMVGGALTKGVNQSVLAQQCAPPTLPDLLPSKKAIRLTLRTAAVVGVAIIAIPATPIASLLAGGCLTVWFIQKSNKEKKLNEEKFNLAYEIWDKKFLCMRCGTQFMPSGAQLIGGSAVNNGPDVLGSALLTGSKV